MKFNLNFLKEFVSIPYSAEELAYQLTMAGAQLASLTQTGEDAVFDIEITSNRPDLLSVVGLSHELAGIVRGTSKAVVKKEKPDTGKKIEIVIKDPEGCSLYRAILIEGVSVGSSPAAIKDVLIKSGFTSVNTIVDITNYCMLKWGHPLHAFDQEKIKGGIIVRRARHQESLRCLDNKERILDEQSLIIADAEKAIALAGIIGGQNTEITSQTKNVLLEAALFTKGRIRIGRRRNGVATESSYRFERDIISRYLFSAQDEAADLIVAHAGGSVTAVTTHGKVPAGKKVVIPVSMERLNAYLGTCLTQGQVRKLLVHVPCSVRARGRTQLLVQPPWFRNDIRREVDVYGEIARKYRYEKIPQALSELPVSMPRDAVEGLWAFKNKLRHFLRGERLREIITYSFLHDEKIRFAAEPERLVEIVNPLKKDERFMRSSLWLTAVDAIRHNLQNAAEEIRFFEIGDVFAQQNGALAEESRLGIYFTESETATVYTVINVIENLCVMLSGEKPQVKEAPQDNFSQRLEIFIQGEAVGSLGILDAGVQQYLNLARKLFVADLSVPALRNIYAAERRYRQFSRFPEVRRDISIGLKTPQTFASVQKVVRGSAPEFLKDISVVGLYTGEKLEKGFRGYTIRITYQSLQRTLSSEEVDTAHARIRERLAATEGLVLR